ncbi:hypothetical protein OKW76_07125 [Sphingomonas sp. S1-29]|uniref:hypothetical protein n=1 Tax=Sphingomonas sp. S1-29 TaxID=2991074 RepID=UPI00223FDA3C|nr:hypothetical protein [Sphingomonas sp. S1-29]UZK70787.1 hypothetical protein OKW76_07125 [Sphingomonas sp. S1-29]
MTGEPFGPFAYGPYTGPKQVFEDGGGDWACWLWLSVNFQRSDYLHRERRLRWSLDGNRYFGDLSMIWFHDLDHAALYVMRWRGLV